MTYSPSSPQDLPPPRRAVTQIRTNFTEFKNIFDNNHAVLNDSNQGKHTNVIMELQGTDPVINGDFVDLFSKLITSTSGISQQLFAMLPKFLPNQQPSTPQQLTFNSVNTAGPVYQTFLPGGYLLFFGQVAQVPGPAVSLPVTLSPAPTLIVCAIANSTTTPGSGGFFYQPVAVSVVNNFQFNVNPSGANSDGFNHIFTWIAIAKQ